ncbi:hypothetical protein RHGRI_025318 [Rhododendron griersonianum]|uniref:Uncharacterized protein n=1 Tax=Rhododendron griersonianum TaxID=479676 RepID=A0AAV6INT9_9ERIC|nr:hypothetical protein RHGRI_025318 [Rhododendron griersonianum]
MSRWISQCKVSFGRLELGSKLVDYTVSKYSDDKKYLLDLKRFDFLLDECLGEEESERVEVILLYRSRGTKTELTLTKFSGSVADVIREDMSDLCSLMQLHVAKLFSQITNTCILLLLLFSGINRHSSSLSLTSMNEPKATTWAGQGRSLEKVAEANSDTLGAGTLGQIRQSSAAVESMFTHQSMCTVYCLLEILLNLVATNWTDDECSLGCQETTSIGGLIEVDRSNWMCGQIGFVGSGTKLLN